MGGGRGAWQERGGMFLREVDTLMHTMVCTIGSFGESLVLYSKRPIKLLSLINQPCQTRPTRFVINSNETLFYPFTFSGNKCGGSCNTIDDPCAPVCSK